MLFDMLFFRCISQSPSKILASKILDLVILFPGKFIGKVKLGIGKVIVSYIEIKEKRNK